MNIGEVEGNDLRKWVHLFDEDGGPSPFAAIHNLGTKNVQVSVRKRDGSFRQTASIVQDANVTLIHGENGSRFFDGDSIIIIG